MINDPAELERRATELYMCECGAALDYPGAWCPACDYDPSAELVPLEEGPDAADLWAGDGSQAMSHRDGLAFSMNASPADRERLAEALGLPPTPRRRGFGKLLGALLATLLGASMFSLVFLGLFLDAHQVDAWIIARKAEAWIWLVGVFQ